jgi:hypothetical protein
VAALKARLENVFGDLDQGEAWPDKLYVSHVQAILFRFSCVQLRC